VIKDNNSETAGRETTFMQRGFVLDPTVSVQRLSVCVARVAITNSKEQTWCLTQQGGTWKEVLGKGKYCHY
jgi:hypothetical protein